MKEIALTHSAEATVDCARRFAARLRAGHVVALQGDLGAGKTHFAKGVVGSLTGLPSEEIHSPTFTLVEEYGGGLPVYHIDLYRLSRPEELQELPWEEWLTPPGISLIEWPERFDFILARCHFKVRFTWRGATQREIAIES